MAPCNRKDAHRSEVRASLPRRRDYERVRSILDQLAGLRLQGRGFIEDARVVPHATDLGWRHRWGG
jgi:hypothetical protein